MTTTMLCSRCQNFDIQAFAPSGFDVRGYPLKAVLRSAESGCSFCSLLLEHLIEDDNTCRKEAQARTSHKGKYFSDLSIVMGNSAIDQRPRTLFHYLHWTRIYALVIVPIWPVWIHFRVRREEDENIRDVDALNVRQLCAFISGYASFGMKMFDHQTPFKSPRVEFNVAADPGTPAHMSQDIVGLVSVEKFEWTQLTLEAVLAWQNHCLLHHSICTTTLSMCERLDLEEAWLPTRCIEIYTQSGERNEVAGNELGFLLRKTEGQKGKYITISHRWRPATGKASTTKANYCCRSGTCGVSLDASHTPRTNAFQGIEAFYEVILLAHKLGVRFIWIDSICIIQDDRNDWKIESVKMAEYYQRAWLTIADASSPGNSEPAGELVPGKFPTITRLPYRDKSGEQKGHFYLQCTGASAVDKEYKECISKSELMQRGWVYQEWLLSRRRLILSDSGVYLKCQHDSPCTIKGEAVRDLRTREEVPQAHADKTLSTVFSETWFIGIVHTLARWRHVVQEYSGLELTQLEGDRLQALSGIASEFRRALRADESKYRESTAQTIQSTRKLQISYTCGLWFPAVEDLLWEQARPGTTFRIKGIPTWSWASMATKPTLEEGTSSAPDHGMHVQWDLDRDYIPWGITVCEPQNAVAVEVEEGSWRPKFSQAGRFKPNSLLGNDHRFFILGILGRSLAVQVHSLFASNEDTTVAAVSTGHHTEIGRGLWRRVTTDTKPDTIRGWASIEHPEFRTDEACRLNGEIDAFFLKKTTGRGAYGLGNLFSDKVPAYRVLYLRRVEVPGFRDFYERIGVGRLFGEEIEEHFESLAERKLWLV